MRVICPDVLNPPEQALEPSRHAEAAIGECRVRPGLSAALAEVVQVEPERALTVHDVAGQIGVARRCGSGRGGREPGAVAWLVSAHVSSEPVLADGGVPAGDPDLHTHHTLPDAVLPRMATPACSIPSAFPGT